MRLFGQTNGRFGVNDRAALISMPFNLSFFSSLFLTYDLSTPDTYLQTDLETSSFLRTTIASINTELTVDIEIL